MEMIAVDWGTTRVRAWRLAGDGRIVDRRARPDGVMAVRGDAFASILEELVGPWIAERPAPIFMCGMVGSRQGWVEVPYVDCPASLADIVAGMRTVRWRAGQAVHVCPGLACADDDGVPDVLRGEESQLVGILAALPSGEVAVCLPGTHSKHVHARDGVIERFSTHMTGEVYAVLREHSILGRSMAGDAIDLAAFDDGVRRSGEGGGLLHHLFGARSRALLEQIVAEAVPAYVSGMLIGHEARAMPASARVHVVAEPPLGDLYVRAFAAVGREATRLDPDAAAIGLHRIATSFNARAAA